MTEMDELLKAAQELRDENDHLKRMNERLGDQIVREGEGKDKEIREKETYTEILAADLDRGREELLNLSEKMTEREEEIWELRLKLEGLGKKEEDKNKDAYIERLEMRLGRGRGELLQKMTEKEEIIKGLETKFRENAGINGCSFGWLREYVSGSIRVVCCLTFNSNGHCEYFISSIDDTVCSSEDANCVTTGLCFS